MLRTFFLCFFLALSGLTPPAVEALDNEQLDAIFAEDQAESVPVYLPEEVPQRVREAIDKNDPSVQYILGHMFQHGRNVQPDLEQSVKWYEVSAKNGHIPSMLALGRLYKAGQGTAAATGNKALPWFRKAAEAGSPEGWYELGVIYENGEGVFKNEKKAFQCYQKAAEGGLANAHAKMGLFYQNGIGTKVDVRKSVRHFNAIREISKDPNVQALVSALLGSVYADVAELEKEQDKRLQWYRFSAEHGEVRGMVMLADAYRDGRGLKQDYKQAIDWYRQASERESVYAMESLGYIYSNGLGVERDYKAGLEWYRRAAELQSAEAAWNVGNFYYYGHGVDKDQDEAQKWYLRAEALRNKKKS